MRGIAALTVVLFHAFWVNPLRNLSWVHNTYLMVDLFFVLSGFVICHAYAHRIRDRVELRDRCRILTAQSGERRRIICAA